MAGFVQIIEFRTSRIKEIEGLGRGAKMAAQCVGPVILHNLDVA